MNHGRWAALAIAVGLVLRVGVACWNGLAGPSYGAEADARRYHEFAVKVARGEPEPTNRPHGFVYSRALGQVYRVTGESLLVGSLLSCIAWLGSALALLTVMHQLDVSPSRMAAGMTIYALLPTSVIWTAITMREAYQLLFVNLSVVAAVKILHSPRLWLWPVLLALVAAGAVFHAVILVGGVLLVSAVLGIEIWRMPRSAASRYWMLASTVVVLAVAGFVVFGSLYRYNFVGGPTAFIDRLTQGGLWYSARTVYRVQSAVDPLVFGPLWLAQYLFEPMPWRAYAVIDWAFAAENFVRLVLIGMTLRTLWHCRGRERTHVALLFLLYLAVESMWSVGTFNWGTAARHHIPTLGLLVAGAVAYSHRDSMREVRPFATS